ncbi:cytochrome P450 [Acrasis kona]|uniref:Cytochrome P450 n=1 Tax=Acrasis kona TaxID=1008807 RepID=A0AAW2Z1L3_9EUKA
MIQVIAALVLVIPILAFIAVKVIDHRARNRFKKVSKIAKHDTMPSAGLLDMFYSFFINPFLKQKEHQSMLVFNRYNKIGRDNGIYHSFFGTFDNINVVDPEAMKTVLLNPKTFPKFPLFLASERGLISRFLGRNLVFTEGEEWRTQRHIINPAFYDMSKFYKAFDSHIDKCLDNLEKDAETGPVNIPTHMTNMTIDILGMTVLGQDFGAQDGRLDAVIDSYLFLMKTSFQPLKILFSFLATLPTKSNRDFNQHLDRFDKFVFDIIEKTQNKHKNGEVKEDDPQTLLDLMLLSQDDESGAKLSMKSLRDNIVVFFVAGHETTASSLGFEFYRLGEKPQIQQKLYQEIKDTLNGDINNLTMELLLNMEYLDAFVKETMRFHPPATGVTGKIAAEDTTLCGYRIPKGTMISPSIYTVHHSDVYYGADVEDFRPERFLGAEGKKIHRFAHVPFSAGLRVCIGNNFSLIEQKLFLVKLLMKYEVQLTEGYQYKTQMGTPIMCMDDNFSVNLKKRQ